MKKQPFQRGHRLKRRSFLTGAGGIAVGLPFLEGLALPSAHAQAGSPVYSLFICAANGVVRNGFNPSQQGALSSGSFGSSATGVLAEVADRLLIIKGVNYPHFGSGCGHSEGLQQCLTAARPGGGSNTSQATGISADTRICNELGTGDPLTLYAGRKEGFIDEKLSFSAAGQVRSAEGNPFNVYNRLMNVAGLDPAGGTSAPSGGDSTVQDVQALRKNSVNDIVKEELDLLLTRTDLSSVDRRRLEQHFESIRDIEIGMADVATTPSLACSDAGLDVDAMQSLDSGERFRAADDTIEQVAELQMKLTAFAFACDLHRTATLQWGDGTDHTRYTIDGQVQERFHFISHRNTSDASSGAPIANAESLHHEIDKIRMGTLLKGIQAFDSYGTERGSLLDDGFIYWTCHNADGPSHSFQDLPIVIAGNAGGQLKQGQFISVNAQNSQVLNTLITAALNNGTQVTDHGNNGAAGGLLNDMLG